MTARTGFFFLLLMLTAATLGAASEARAQAGGDEPLYYVTARNATLYRTAAENEPYMQLKFREPLYQISKQGRWSQVRTRDGARGYIPTGDISNVWLRVSKTRQTVYIYRGVELLKAVPADLGYNAFADKERRGSRDNRDHWRTPEGSFTIVRKNPRSTFYKALVLSYPSREHAERGLRDGLISQADYAAIARADAQGEMPPMHTALGGMIEIHGNGTGARSNWTQGCVAIQNTQMDELYELVSVGTPVLVEP